METINKTSQTGQSSDPCIKTVAGKTYWTSTKAAEYLGVSKMTLHNYVKQDLLSSLSIKGFVLHQKEWLDDFIDEKTKICTANKKKNKPSP